MNESFMYTPWSLINEVIGGSDRFERMFRDIARVVDGKYPPANVYSSDKEIVLDIEMPGVDKKDVSIDLEERSITIGFPSGNAGNSGSRKFDLPFDVDKSKVTAVFKNGVLRISLPKAEAVGAKRIEISD